ncbi:unnamed protein product [Polarella glacialis]|uniref:RING-type domain-containing protein n=1 Tax=Polarella glacialis TaxID=89957 RepID=A0A813KYJ5_POLGL|nr:unnamed protein product [Polarella glacialis]CAE8715713.1 unnamed protein product [Polarella glacialis]
MPRVRWTRVRRTVRTVLDETWARARLVHQPGSRSLDRLKMLRRLRRSRRREAEVLEDIADHDEDGHSNPDPARPLHRDGCYTVVLRATVGDVASGFGGLSARSGLLERKKFVEQLVLRVCSALHFHECDVGDIQALTAMPGACPAEDTKQIQDENCHDPEPSSGSEVAFAASNFEMPSRFEFEAMEARRTEFASRIFDSPDINASHEDVKSLSFDSDGDMSYSGSDDGDMSSETDSECYKPSEVHISIGSTCGAGRMANAIESGSAAQFEMCANVEHHNPFQQEIWSGHYNVLANMKFVGPCSSVVDAIVASMAELASASPCVGHRCLGCTLLPHAKVEEEIQFVGRRANGAPEQQLWLTRTTGAADDWRVGVSTRFELFLRKPEPGGATDPICIALLCYTNQPSEGYYVVTQPTLKWIAVREKYQGKGYGRSMMLEVERFLRLYWTLAPLPQSAWGSLPAPPWPDFLILDVAGASIAPHPNACKRYPAQAFFEAMGYKFDELEEEAKRVVYRNDAWTEIVSGNHGARTSQCAVCLSSFRRGDRVTRLNCSRPHYFHARCIDPVLQVKGSCPSCRRDILGFTEARTVLDLFLQRGNSLFA